MGSQSLSDMSATDGLGDLLAKEECRGFPDNLNQKYLPSGIYEAYLNESLVRSELRLDPYDRSKDTARLIQFILTKARKVFLALVDLGWDPALIHRYLEQFQKQNFTDVNLPFEMDFCHSSPAFAQWGIARQNKMFESQWKFLAPIFSKDNFNPKLHPMQPLPFTEIGLPRGGGTAVVYRVQVHPPHLEDPPVDVSQFERVTIQGRDD